MGIKNLSIVTIFFMASVSSACAYELNSVRWSDPQTEFAGNMPEGPMWQDAFAAAAQSWNDNTPFKFVVTEANVDPCRLPLGGIYKNGIAFTQTRCGGAQFSPSTLAITISWSQHGELIQTGIVFNAKDHVWDVYDGPWQYNVADFHRVAVHELGHAAGLGHESHKPAIMAPIVGSLTAPTSDDIAGIQARYDFGPLLATGFELDAEVSQKAVQKGSSGPIMADMDGDGVAESISYREIDGLWTWQGSADGRTSKLRMGGPGQMPIPADFDGDGIAEPATWSVDGTWRLWNKAESSSEAIQTSVQGMVTVQAAVGEAAKLVDSKTGVVLNLSDFR